MPSVSGVESTMQPGAADATAAGDGAAAESGGPRLSLPTTGVIDATAEAPARQPAGEDGERQRSPLSDALFEQEALLEEFAKVAAELNQLLAHMEGSTLVKRLKAAARQQQQIADRLAEAIGQLFGTSGEASPESVQLLDELARDERAAAQTVAFIMDDIQGYFERRRLDRFLEVLHEMRQVDVLLALQQLADELRIQHGLAIAEAEYWADTLDRWAEELLEPLGDTASTDEEEPTTTDEEPAAPDAIPPQLLVEILRVLRCEVDLREETRVVEQSRGAVATTVHDISARQLQASQLALKTRLIQVVNGLLSMPQGEQRFAQEIDLLRQVSMVMDDAAALLARSVTDQRTIAAETEAIELLLQSQRIPPQGKGSGGGATPGGGRNGTTDQSALAMIGAGLNPREHREERAVSQATGHTGDSLPEEFRAGLDIYFQQIEEVLP